MNEGEGGVVPPRPDAGSGGDGDVWQGREVREMKKGHFCNLLVNGY